MGNSGLSDGGPEDFMKRPTDVLASYLARRQDPWMDRDRYCFRLGRIAMAMELMTVVRIIEEYSLLPTKEDTIAVIQTLIVDQDLLEDADVWYKELSDWRRIKLAGDDAVYGAPDAQPSVRAALGDDEPQQRSIDAPHGSDQMTDPPSSE